MALFALADLSVYLQQTVDTTVAQLAHDNALGAIQAESGQDVDQVVGDVVTLVCPREQFQLTLPQRPVTAVTSVKVGGVEIAGWQWDGDVTVWSRFPFGYPVSTALFLPPTVQVAVTYTHGWADPKPKWLKELGLRVAARFVDNPTGMSQESVDDYSGKYAGDSVGSVFDDSDRSALKRLGRSGAFSVVPG